MNPIIERLPKLNKYIEYINNVKKSIYPIGLNGFSDAQKSHFIYSTSHYTDERPFCVITQNEISAKNLVKDLKQITNEKIMFLGKKEVSVYDYEAGSKENIRNRAYVLSKLANNEVKILITTADAVIVPVIDKKYYQTSILYLKQGEEVNIENIKSILIRSGYERVEMVEGKGQFCIRGGIIDVYPNNLETGIRIELWGDEIDSIRTFNVINQLSVEMLNEVKIYPCEEYILDESFVNKFILNIKNLNKTKLTVKEAEKIESDIEEIENGNYLNKIDKYFSCMYEKTYSVIEYLPEDMLIFVDEPERVVQRINNSIFENGEVIKSIIEKGKFVPDYFYQLLDLSYITNILEKKKLIYLNRLEKNTLDINMPAKRKEYSFNCREVNFFRDSMDIFIQEVEKEYRKGKSILILLQNKVKASNIYKEFVDLELNVKQYNSIDFIDKLDENKIYITIGYNTNSYEYRDLKLLVLSDSNEENIPKKRQYKSSVFKDAKKVVLADLSPNDYVVHVTYGIGQFIGINTIDVNGVKKDYVKIKYQNNDMLYVPTVQLDVIRKYVALNDGVPKLNKLGSKDWAKAKNKAKKSIEDVARKLVELYAQRQNSKGFAFLPDTDWQKQFEDDFPYQETDDQIRCINEVKQDMEKQRPMERLLCGDVGYGKTEVAIRAAFKAVMSGKQVAYLVPTTVLAKQQYETFNSRMKEYGIRVEVLNRFKTRKEQQDIINKLKLGELDIVIGTHRLIQKDVEFKNLGFLIIDEEHRFGVTHKEKIKELKKDIDVLSMTATPIPRTLHMSIVGIRDMSVIYDPPHNRKPVQTYVLEYDKYLIQDALIRELERNGQVFYLYNKVEDIEEKAIEIQKLVPNAVVEFAHGQMSGNELENIMYDFSEKKIDVLVCTTIVETGLDIPNANTMIIENADKMGLAQLYLIRGRVGRKDKQAYAYITYRKNKLLSENSEKRLKAIKEFTEFGSGFKIALRDLEIRGAGNILGSEQHGHMEAIGYEMYCKLLDDAVKVLKGETVYEDIEIQIDLKISAYIPDTYIENQNQKIEVYQNIALCTENEHILEIIDEMVDRYGSIPIEVENLIEIAKIKNICRKLGIFEISQKQNKLIFKIGENNNINGDNIVKLVDKYRLEISIENNMIIKRLKSNEQEYILDIVKDFLQILS